MFWIASKVLIDSFATIFWALKTWINTFMYPVIYIYKKINTFHVIYVTNAFLTFLIQNCWNVIFNFKWTSLELSAFKQVCKELPGMRNRKASQKRFAPSDAWHSSQKDIAFLGKSESPSSRMKLFNSKLMPQLRFN